MLAVLGILSKLVRPEMYEDICDFPENFQHFIPIHLDFS